MEVDRISRMGGVGRDATPAWQNSAKRRRKFVDEVEPPEPENEDLPAESDESPADSNQFSAQDTDAVEGDDQAEISFRTIA